jgi:virulence-associated protein VapD
MFAITFDLDTKEAAKHFTHLPQAYQEIKTNLSQFGFINIQGSVYVCEDKKMENDMANLFMALNKLKTLPWFSVSVRDIRAFRIEQWSDFTAMMKS